MAKVMAKNPIWTITVDRLISASLDNPPVTKMEAAPSNCDDAIATTAQRGLMVFLKPESSINCLKACIWAYMRKRL